MTATVAPTPGPTRLEAWVPQARAGWPVGNESAEGSPGGASPAEIVRGLMAVVAGIDPAMVSAREQVELLTALEELKACAAGLQVRATADLDGSLRAEHIARGGRAEGADRTIASTVGLARRVSPWWGARHARAACALVDEMPRTLAALCRGAVAEDTALLMVTATADLREVVRAEVDARLGDQAGSMSRRELAGAC